eukprot:gb/GFBE01068421.1/.p1 GENE.gb/GFBE01068421.1/~~gb/GFBE01068421.1/.p1  ORF type:complete len:604 (+),score=123.16 gb/GFBE01068421.1/:1-1812(+)
MPGPPKSSKEKGQSYMPATGHSKDESKKGSVLGGKGRGDKQNEGMLGGLEEYRPDVANFLESTNFDMGIGAVIVLNSVFLGIEISLTLEGQDSIGLPIVESIFLVIYAVELGMRFFAYGFVKAFKIRWVQFDAFLLALGISTTWIIEPLTAGSQSAAADALGPVMVLRTLRLLRLSRTVKLFRLLAKYREFWLLVRGFMKSLSLMACTVVVLTVSLYVFACLGVELITNHAANRSSEVFKNHVDLYFSNLPVTMMTLLRFAVLDNTSEVYSVLVREDPWLFGYFAMLTIMVSLISFHLIAAVIFSTTLEQGRLESDAIRAKQEEEYADFFRDLKKMFLRMDRDGSGQLSIQEVQKIHPSDLKKLNRALGFDSPEELFQNLDLDGSGQVSITEFFDGAFEMILNQTLKRNNGIVKRSEKQIELISWKMKDLVVAMHEMDIRIQQVSDALEKGGGGRSMAFAKGGMAGSAAGSTCGSSYCGDGSSMGYAGGGRGAGLGASGGDGMAQLTEKLQKIWEEAVQFSMELTMQQIDEARKAGKPAKERKSRVDGKKGGMGKMMNGSHSDAGSDYSDTSNCSKPKKMQQESFTPRSQASVASSVSQRAVV